MKALSISMFAALMLTPAHGWAADVPVNETELHIEAIGSVTADSAIYDLTVSAGDHGIAGCQAAMADLVAKTKGRLLSVGLPANAVTLTSSACEPASDVDWPVNAFANSQTMRGVETVVVPDTVVASDATAAATMAANAAARAGRIQAEREKMKLPLFGGKLAVSVKVADLSKLPAIQRAVGGLQFGFNTGHTAYIFNHPGDVQATAVVAALSKARKDADLIASALGCHVVRIARVSNHAGSPSLTDIVNLLGQMKGPDVEWTLAATHSVSIAMDFVTAPN